MVSIVFSTTSISLGNRTIDSSSRESWHFARQGAGPRVQSQVQPGAAVPIDTRNPV